MPDGRRGLTFSGHTCRVDGVAIAGVCAPGLSLGPARAAASDILRTAWPDAERPARTAVGVASRPDGAFIEIEMDAVLHPVTDGNERNQS